MLSKHGSVDSKQVLYNQFLVEKFGITLPDKFGTTTKLGTKEKKMPNGALNCRVEF